MERQPRYPNLLNCPCVGEECALLGCFFQRLVNKIDPNKLGVMKAQEVKEDMIKMGSDCGCLIIKNI